MPPSASTHQHRSESHSVPFTLFGIMLAIGMVGLALAYGLEMLLARQHTAQHLDGAPPVVRTLVGKQLTIPAAWLRDASARQQGFASEIDLQLDLPLGANGSTATVDVTLLPLSQARPSASLLDGVYLHQFMPNELSGPPGLIGKPLYATEGYDSEVVWYDALSESPFVAKCISPPADAAGPARCLRTVALPDGLAAVYAFDSDLLASWKSFDPEMKTRLTQIGAL